MEVVPQTVLVPAAVPGAGAGQRKAPAFLPSCPKIHVFAYQTVPGWRKSRPRLS